MSNSQMEELAALHALGMLDEASAKTLQLEAAADSDLQKLVSAYANAASFVAYDAPPVAPSPALKNRIMAGLPRQRQPRKIISFPQWVPYALAACLVGLATYQANEIFTLSRQIGAEHASVLALQQHNDMSDLQLASLETKGAGYVSAKVMVAWDPETHNGVVSIHNLPAPPAGHDYQLWVLDPKATAPISAGLLKTVSGSQGFAVHPVRSDGPGFAISLEPAGGRPAPTGAILFAIAPTQ